jgi:hypothetical protein
VKLTRAQRESLKKVFLRTTDKPTLNLYRAFRRKVQWGWGCIMVPFSGMWLGIEPCGYTHS